MNEPHRLTFVRWIVAALAGVGVAASGQAQNLVANPDFLANLEGWTQGVTNPFTYDPAQGSPANGSALGTYTPTSAPLADIGDGVIGFCVELKQCVTVVPGRRYQFG